MEIKVLWLCGNPGLFRARSLADGGWIGALQTQLLETYADISIVNVFEYPYPAEALREERVSYYPVHIGKTDRMKALFFPKHHDDIFLQHVRRIIEQEHPDLIQCWGSELGFGLIARETNIPVVMHIQGLLNPYLDAYCPPFYSIDSLWRAVGYNPIAYLRHQWRPFRLFCSNAHREREILAHVPSVLGRTTWDKECATILAPQARYYFCSESLRKAVTAHAPWTWHDSKRLVVSTVMSTAIYKGVDVILRTARLLKATYGENFEWNIYGVDNVRIHERITGICASEVNVYPRGRVSAEIVADKLTKSDVYCHQSYIENSPNSVCEAQYLGVPVVAAMVGGVDTLLHEDAGILVPANDAYRSASAILRLKRENKLADAVSRREREKAIPRHSNVEVDLMNIYREITKR